MEDILNDNMYVLYCKQTSGSETNGIITNASDNTDLYFKNEETKAKVSTLILDNNIDSIDYGVFSGYLNLKNVILSENNNFYIAGQSFYNCTSLEKVIVPSTCRYTQGGIFSDCKNLKYINLVENKNVITIPAGMFRGLNISELVLYEGIEIIGKEAFLGAIFQNYIILPHTLKTIDKLAFGGVINTKNDVLYKGSQEDWNNVTKDESVVEVNCNIYFYAEDKPMSTGNYWHYDTSGIATKWD